MKPNAEQIKKAFEYCKNNDGECPKECPLLCDTECTQTLGFYGLSLIHSYEQKINSQEQRIGELESFAELEQENESLGKMLMQANDRITKLQEQRQKLTEENEMLQTIIFKKEDLMQRIAQQKQTYYDELVIARAENDRLKNRITCQVVLPDEKLEEIKNECLERVELDIKAIQADTVREMQERVKALFAPDDDVQGEIDQIAKEMLEGEK